jgi:hypothetical protein
LILTVQSYRGRYFTGHELNESTSENEGILFMDKVLMRSETSADVSTIAEVTLFSGELFDMRR